MERFARARRAVLAVAVAAWAVGGCARMRDSLTSPGSYDTERQKQAIRVEEAQPALEALGAARFADAVRLSSAAVANDRENTRARAIRALARYAQAAQSLSLDARAVFAAGTSARGPGPDDPGLPQLRAALALFDGALALVDEDLYVIAADATFALELCPGCWAIDWDADGRVDLRERAVLEVEHDAGGARLAFGDPRRRPVFRLDVGDAHWARAQVHFQRALVQLVLAFDWPPLDELVGLGIERPLVLRLANRARIEKARRLLVHGLDEADSARERFAAETDDDRELVPAPRQRRHPIPLPFDAAVWDAWGETLGEVRRVVTGAEALAVADLLRLAGRDLRDPPRGLLDVGALFDEPRDLVLDLRPLTTLDPARGSEGLEAAAAEIFGAAYRRARPASALPARLIELRQAVQRGETDWRRALAYVLWLN